MARLTRREWHKLALGGAAAAAGILPGAARRAAAATQAESRFAGVLIGLQSYSFRDLSLDDGIAAMQQLGITSCELWQGHVEPRQLGGRDVRADMRRWRLTVPLDHFRSIRERFEQAGLTLDSYNISFQDHFSDDEIDRGFEMAKALGVPAITASAHVNSVPRIARMAGVHGIPVAMHNHSVIDANQFSSPAQFAAAVAQGDGRSITVNLDIGHFVAANHDPVAWLRDHHEQVTNLHLKDRRRNQGPNVPWGEGDAPIMEILRMVRDEGWDIPCNIEYEYRGGDTVEEVRRCFDFCRSALDAQRITGQDQGRQGDAFGLRECVGKGA
jgi:sugar phosphate isomerase/epimerase